VSYYSNGSGGQGARPRLATDEDALAAIACVRQALVSTRIERNGTARLQAVRIMLEQWRWQQEGLERGEGKSELDSLSADERRMLLAADPKLREMARNWSEETQ
jgi:hypothetical protein